MSPSAALRFKAQVALRLENEDSAAEYGIGYKTSSAITRCREATIQELSPSPKIVGVQNRTLAANMDDPRLDGEPNDT